MVESPVVTRPGLLPGVLRRRWTTLLLLTLLGGLAGGAAASSLPTSYTASASLFLEPLTGNPFSPATAATRNEQVVALQTEVALFSTSAVEQLAREEAPALPVEAADGVSASVPSNSQVVDVAYTAPTATLARDGAEAFASAFLRYRQVRSDRVETEQSAELQQQLDDTTALLVAATDRLEAAPEDTGEYVQLQQQVQLYASQVSDLQVQLLALSSSAARPGEVISPAELPTQPDGLSPGLVALAGLLAGAAVGVLLGLYREHQDSRMHSVTDGSQLGTGAVLAVVGAPGTATPSSGSGDRRLEAAVLASLPPVGGVVTLVGADRTTSSADAATGLAGALVRSGHRCTVVLAEPVAGVVEAAAMLSEFADTPSDTSRPRTWLEVEVEPGLRLVAINPAAIPGEGADALDDILQHERTRQLVHELAAAGRIVVVAAPPLPRGAALSLARQADQAVLLARLGRTHFDVAEAGVESLRRADVPLLGTVMQTGPARVSPHGGATAGPGPESSVATGARAALRRSWGRVLRRGGGAPSHPVHPWLSSPDALRDSGSPPQASRTPDRNLQDVSRPGTS